MRRAILVSLGASIALSSAWLGTRSKSVPDDFAPAANRASQALNSQADNNRRELQRKIEKLRRQGTKTYSHPDEAARMFVEQRLAEGTTELPLEELDLHRREIEAREQALAALRGRSGPGSIIDWQWIGPGNVGGRTRAIIIHPFDPSIMYASGVTGGVWKSTDGGANWSATGDMLPNITVSALAMDPANPNILFAGTGEGFFPPASMHRGLGIYKTTDAGANWTLLSGTTTGAAEGMFHYVNKIRISPNDSNRIYAATRSGVWRSLDGGQSWSILLANPTVTTGPQESLGCTVGCTDLALRTDVSPGNPDVIFAAFGSFQSDGLYRSNDGGDSWIRYTVPSNQGRMTLAFAPSDNNVLYLLMADNGTGGLTGQMVNIYRSLNGGDTFEGRLDFTHPFSTWLMSYVSIALGCIDQPTIYTQGWYDNIIAVDPLNPDRVWVGGIDLYRSEDGARTFGMAGYWFGSLSVPQPPTYLHPDQHVIAFHPDYDGVTNTTLYIGNDGGLFVTTNSLAATTQEECPLCPEEEPGCEFGPPPEITWKSLNNGYGVTQYYFGESSRNEDVYLGGAQDNGTSLVISTDTPNDWKRVFSGDGGYTAIDPRDSQVMFLEYQGFPNIYKSVDGGDTFNLSVNGITDTDGLFISPLAMDINNPDVLWTGGQRPWRTTNSAASWQLVGPNFSGPNQISAIGIAPSDSNVVYLGFNNGYVARSINALAPSPNWSIFTNGLTGGWVSSVAVDPDNPNIAYCTYSNYGTSTVRRTVNGGLNWSPLEGGDGGTLPAIPAHWIAIRRCDTQQLYVGTELGVFASDDGGANWQPSNPDLPKTIVESLHFKNTNTLVAFTHGRGAHVAALETCPSCLERTGDMDGDGLIDNADFTLAAPCFAGPNVGIAPTGCDPCEFANIDLDADGDADLRDMAEFQIVAGN